MNLTPAPLPLPPTPAVIDASALVDTALKLGDPDALRVALKHLGRIITEGYEPIPYDDDELPDTGQ